MKRTPRAVTWMAAGLFALVNTVGCMSVAKYDSQNRYIGQETKTDPGKVVETVGWLNGGLFGLALQGLGRHHSNKLNEHELEKYRLTNQKQLDARANAPRKLTPREQFEKEYTSGNSSIYVCNSVSDSNGNGDIEPDEFIGDFSGTFALDEPITAGFFYNGEAGKRIGLQLRTPEGISYKKEFVTELGTNLIGIEVPIQGRSNGNYTFIVSNDGVYTQHGQFEVRLERVSHHNIITGESFWGEK